MQDEVAVVKRGRPAVGGPEQSVDRTNVVSAWIQMPNVGGRRKLGAQLPLLSQGTVVGTLLSRSAPRGVESYCKP